MPDFPLSQSPKTQGFQVPPGPQDEDDLFRQGFEQLAYQAFGKANPQLMAEIVSFRPLDTDASQGKGVGAFILQHGQEAFLVPCVVSDNAVKPIDMFYSRRLDRYYPLTNEWLQEASKGSLQSLGQGVTPPKTLPTDVDIRNLVVPPTTGRYSYAAAADDPGWAAFAAARLEMDKSADEGMLYLPAFLNDMPSTVKTAAANFLKKNHRLLKAAAEFYGAKVLSEALAPKAEKKAAQMEMPLKRDVFLITASTPIQEIRQQMGADAGRAYSEARRRGFYVKDVRKDTDDALEFAETMLDLVEPKAPGLYRVYLATGSVETALIVPHPIHLHERHSDDDGSKRQGYYRDNRNMPGARHVPHCFLVLLEDGRAIMSYDLVATPVVTASHEDIEKFIKKHTTELPKNGERGVLLCTSGLTVKATKPLHATQVSTRDDVTTFQADWGWRVIINGKQGGSACMKPINEPLLTVSGNYRWFKTSDDSYEPSAIMANPTQIFRAVEHDFMKEGAVKISCHRAGRHFMVGRDQTLLDVPHAVVKLAQVYNLSLKSSLEVVKRAAEYMNADTFWVTPRAKVAAGETLGDPNDPNNPPPVDPSQQQGPQGPSGMDLAISEQMQLVNNQIAALQQQMQVLQQVSQRAQQIDAGGGASAAPMGAAAMAAGPAQGPGGQPAMAPMPPDPSQGGGQGGPPPQDPSQGGGQGAPPPQDPSQGGQGAPPPQGPPPSPPQGMMQPGGGPGMAQGMDPSQGQPTPPPVMREEPTPENIESQINPAFLGQAASLMQAGVFDAAAIASLAQQKGLRDKVQAYTPTLDHALDNLGRVLLLFRLQEAEIKEQIGNDQHTETEQKLRDVFLGLGDALLRINQSTDQLNPGSSRPTA